jgi:hypothetical protein
LSDEVIVFFVAADPEPNNKITMLLCNRAIVIFDPERPNISEERHEMHGRMKRIANPELKLFADEALDVRW